MVSEKVRKEIEDMSYVEMLRLWRNAPSGHHMFAGETGVFFTAEMNRKRTRVGHEAHVAASKKIGWRN